MQPDLPEPVVPAISRCGIRARSQATPCPEMSLPSQAVSGLAAGRQVGVDVAQRDEVGREIGHLDADRLLAGDRGEDADLGRRERVGQVVAQLGHAAHLDAGGELQLVPGDAGAAHHPHHSRLDAEVRQRLDELLGDLLVILAGAAAGRAALEDRRLRQPVGRSVGRGHRTAAGPAWARRAGRRPRRRPTPRARARRRRPPAARAPRPDRAPRRTGRRRHGSRRPAGARARGSAPHAAPAVRRAARDTGARPPRRAAPRLRPRGPRASPTRASRRPARRR